MHLHLLQRAIYANSGSEARSDDTASQALLSAPAGLSKDAAALSTDSTKALRMYWTSERLKNAVPMPLLQAKSGTFSQKDKSTNHTLPPLIIEPTLPVNKIGLENEQWTNVIENTDGLKWDDANSQAARINGKLWFSKPGGGTYVCSASAVTSAGKSLIATASHCVRDKDGFYTNFFYVPAHSQESGSYAPYGEWTAKEIYSANDEGHGGSNDVAFIVLNPDSKGRKLEDVTGASGLIFNIPRDKAEQLSFRFGYPANRYGGQELTYCYNKGTYEEGWLKHSCNMTGGSSGGPVVTDFPHNAYSYGHIFGVASVTYGGTPATTGQATFGDTEQRTYKEAGKLLPDVYEENGYIKLKNSFDGNATWHIHNPQTGHYYYGAGKEVKISRILEPDNNKEYLEFGDVIYVYARALTINADGSEGKRVMTNKIELKIR